MLPENPYFCLVFASSGNNSYSIKEIIKFDVVSLSSYMLERENPTRSIFWLVGFCHLNVNVNSDFRFDCIVYILPGSLIYPVFIAYLKFQLIKLILN